MTDLSLSEWQKRTLPDAGIKQKMIQSGAGLCKLKSLVATALLFPTLPFLSSLCLVTPLFPLPLFCPPESSPVAVSPLLFSQTLHPALPSKRVIQYVSRIRWSLPCLPRGLWPPVSVQVSRTHRTRADNRRESSSLLPSIWGRFTCEGGVGTNNNTQRDWRVCNQQKSWNYPQDSGCVAWVAPAWSCCSLDTLSVLGKHDPRCSVSDQYNSAAPGVSPPGGAGEWSLSKHTSESHSLGSHRPWELI